MCKGWENIDGGSFQKCGFGKCYWLSGWVQGGNLKHMNNAKLVGTNVPLVSPKCIRNGRTKAVGWLFHAVLYAGYFQQLFHLLWRAASEGIANPDEETEVKGGEMEGMRGKT